MSVSLWQKRGWPALSRGWKVVSQETVFKILLPMLESKVPPESKTDCIRFRTEFKVLHLGESGLVGEQWHETRRELRAWCFLFLSRKGQREDLSGGRGRLSLWQPRTLAERNSLQSPETAKQAQPSSRQCATLFGCCLALLSNFLEEQFLRLSLHAWDGLA